MQYLEFQMSQHVTTACCVGSRTTPRRPAAWLVVPKDLPGGATPGRSVKKTEKDGFGRMKKMENP